MESLFMYIDCVTLVSEIHVYYFKQTKTGVWYFKQMICWLVLEEIIGWLVL